MIYAITYDYKIMATKAVNITIDTNLLEKTDILVAEGKYPNRSQLFQEAVNALVKEIEDDLIGIQAKLLAPSSEQESEEWFEGELDSWKEQY